MNAGRGQFSNSNMESFSASANAVAKRLVVIQTRLVYSQGITGLVAELAATVIITGLLWGIMPHTPLFIWLGTAGAAGVAHLALLIAFRHRDPVAEEMPGWAGKYVALSMFCGLLWGAAGLLTIVYGTLTQQVIVALILAGLAAVAFATRTQLAYALAGFLIPAMVPMAGWFLLHSQPAHLAMGSLLLMLATLFLVVAKQSRTRVSKLSKLGLDNNVLMRRLAKAKDEADLARLRVESANEKLHEEMRERELAQDQIASSERELNSILRNIQDAIFRTDLSGTITWVSPSIQQLLEYPPDELLGNELRNLYADEDGYLDFVQQLESHFGSINHHAAQLRRADSTLIWASTNAHYFHDADGDILGIEGTIRDITDYKQSQEALHQEKGRAQVTLESIGDGVITTDVNGRIEYLNVAAEKLTGWRNSDARGKPIQSVLQLVDESTRKPIPDHPVERCLREGQTVGLSQPALLINRNAGNEFSIENTAAPIRDLDRNISGSVLVFHDVTKLRSLTNQMAHLASHDPLTGLINRREFEVQLDAMLESARSDDKHHCVCYVDLDQFKIVNDTAGHLAGDELLKGVTQHLNSKLREADTLARLGGDEFGVLLKGCALDNGKEIAETLREAVRKYRFQWEGKEFRVGASIGVVPVNQESSGLSEILRAADSAMYVAKEGGRNRVHVFEPDDSAVAERTGEMQWTQRLQTALDHDRFELYFQPISSVHSRSGGLDGEVLLRLRDEHDNIIEPRSFMPAAERYHLMPAIDRWVVHNVFSALHNRQREGMDPICCTVNLSGQTLSDEDFLDFVLDEMHDAQIAPGRLCFEITETAVVSNIEAATHVISELRQLGCAFALDDFGSGLSSFAYLKNLPVEYLKIDGSFVRNMVRDEKDHSVVKAINEIGHVMGIQTIAEFVENRRTLKMLDELKVDFVQGYTIGRPRPFQRGQRKGETSGLCA